MPTLTTFIQHSIWRTRAIRQKEEIKGIRIRKEVTSSLLTDDMIELEKEKKKTKNLPKKLSELMKEFSKLQYTKSNIKKPVH